MMASLIYGSKNLILLILVLNYPIWGVLGGWSASTIIEVAADLLESSDDQSLQHNSANDPLVDSITNHDHLSKGKENGGDHDVGGDERFMVPMLSNSVGDNNQLMEYMTAAVVARATKRTLCLTPFFNGPIKHTRKLPTGGLTMEERYDMNLFGKFVKVSSLQRCLQECNKQINSFWWLRHSSASSLGRDWTWDPRKVKKQEFGGAFVNWRRTEDIKEAVEGVNSERGERCAALGGLFPGLRWRGAYLAPSFYIRPAQSILTAATALQTQLAIGGDGTFLAVHWRFEESLCKGEQLGLCFLRCGDGAVIDSGLHAVARGWPSTNKTGPLLEKERGEEGRSSCKRIVDSKGVMVAKKDLITAIRDKASKENVSSVYIATDGWLRGSHAQGLVKEVVEDLRKQGLAVTGLWKIKELPNLITGARDHTYSDKILQTTLRGMLTGHAISEVEQEICLRAGSFMGSGESTWSLSVFRARLVRRRWKQLVLSGRFNKERVVTAADTLVSDDNLLIEELLHDPHAAGLQCRYKGLFKRAKMKGVVPEESYQDEAPDSWLDVEACEAQLSLGGSCKLLDCFP